MAWFTPLDRRNHPCTVPDQEERKKRRHGEMWRCEVCTELWVLRVEAPAYSLSGPKEWVLHVVESWRDRWRYRKEGYTNGSSNSPGLPTD